LIAAILAVAGFYGYDRWRNRPASSAETETQEKTAAVETPPTSAVKESSAKAPSASLDTAMQGLFHALEGSKDGAVKKVYDTQLAGSWFRHGGAGIEPLRDNGIAWGLLTVLWETKSPGFARGERSCLIYQASQPVLSHEIWNKYEEHPTNQDRAMLDSSERDLVGWWFCQLPGGAPALPGQGNQHRQVNVSDVRTCEELIPTRQDKIIQAIDELTARIQRAGPSAPPQCP
jgi:hypothetical protein